MKKYFSFQWHITDECDQRCDHCYIFSENNNIPLVSMPLADMDNVLANINQMCVVLNRTPYLYITGGDPILHKDFWKLLARLKEQDVPFSIMGNPFHLTDEVCKKLREYGCQRYQLSIDGMEKTHDSIRKKGSFQTTLDKIAVINRAGIRSVVMTTVSATNIKEIPAIVDKVVANHVSVFAFARYCPTGSHEDTHVKPQQYRELLDIVWEQFEKYKNSGTTFNLKDHLWKLYLYEKGIFKIQQNLDDDMIYDGCNAGISHLTILPTGDVYACRRMESKVGNVFEDSLSDLFLGESMNQFRQYKSFEKCSECELLRFCRGCPAVAYGYTGNSYSSDPQCWKVVSL